MTFVHMSLPKELNVCEFRDYKHLVPTGLP